MRQSNYFFKNKLHAQLVAIAIAAKAVAMAVAVAQVGTTKYPRRTTREWFPSKRIAVGISGRRIWSELLLLFSYLFPFFLSPGQGRGSVWTGGGGVASQLVSAICVYASFIYLHIDLEFLVRQNPQASLRVSPKYLGMILFAHKQLHNCPPSIAVFWPSI